MPTVVCVADIEEREMTIADYFRWAARSLDCGSPPESARWRAELGMKALIRECQPARLSRRRQEWRSDQLYTIDQLRQAWGAGFAAGRRRA